MSLSTVMYHYIRKIKDSRWPRIRGLELDDFKSQLSYLKRNYTIVSLPEVINALDGGELPDNACLLTFDDGYLDHYLHVFPLLFDAKVPGAFFPIGRSVAERWVADVNKIHFLIADAPLGPWISHVQKHCNPIPVDSRWDDSETATMKRALQTCPGSCAAELFARYVTKDERSFADELYMTSEQIKLMSLNGMFFGVHGWNHVRFSRMIDQEQAADLDASIAFLRGLGVLPKKWAMCYPYGAATDYTEATERLLVERGCCAAFTTHSAVTCLPLAAGLYETGMRLPRIDTNDVGRD